MSPYVQTTLELVVAGSMLIKAVGGAARLRRREVAIPLGAGVFCAALGLACAFGIDKIKAGELPERYHTMFFLSATTLVLLGIGGFVWALVAGHRTRRSIELTVKELAVHRNTDGSPRIDSDASDPAIEALLERLVALTYPAKQIPGHKWVSTEWVSAELDRLRERRRIESNSGA